MKKLLGILVLGLLLSGCMTPQEKQAAQEKYTNEQNHRQAGYYKMMDKARANATTLSSRGIDMIRVGNDFWTTANLVQASNICAQSKKFYFWFGAATWFEELRTGVKRSAGHVMYCSREQLFIDPIYGDDTYHKRGNYYARYSNRLKETNYNAELAENWQKGDVKSVEDSKDLLANIKNTCIEFGYKEGTEKLADCMKDLYLKQTQPTTTIVQGTTTTTKPKRRIDPSVWDDILDVSKGLGEGKSVGEALGGTTSGTSKIQCFKIGERVSGTNQICSYDCMGSETTLNIASTRLCPLSIDYN